MPADLGRLLAFINQLTLDRLQVDVAGPDKLSVQARLGALDLRHASAEGVKIEHGSVALRGMPTAPPQGDPFQALPGVEATLQHVMVRLMPDLWPRLATFLKQSLAARGARMLDRVVVDAASVTFGQMNGPNLPISIQLERQAVRLGDLDCVVVEDVRIRVDDFTPQKDVKAALAAATVVIESLRVRVAGSFLTRTVDTMRDQIPPMVENFGLGLSPGRLTVSGTVRKIVALNFAVDLRFDARGKEAVVQFERFSLAGGLSMPTWLRTQILGVARSKLAREKAVRIDEDTIYIDPRKRIPPPFKVAFDISRFTVEKDAIVIELRAPREFEKAPPPPAPRPEKAPQTAPEARPQAASLPPGPPPATSSPR